MSIKFYVLGGPRYKPLGVSRGSPRLHFIIMFMLMFVCCCDRNKVQFNSIQNTRSFFMFVHVVRPIVCPTLKPCAHERIGAWSLANYPYLQPIFLCAVELSLLPGRMRQGKDYPTGLILSAQREPDFPVCVIMSYRSSYESNPANDITPCDHVQRRSRSQYGSDNRLHV